MNQQDNEAFHKHAIAEDPRRPWHPASELPPRKGEYSVILDGRGNVADWTGTEWWCYKGHCEPTYWRECTVQAVPDTGKSTRL